MDLPAWPSAPLFGSNRLSHLGFQHLLHHRLQSSAKAVLVRQQQRVQLRTTHKLFLLHADRWHLRRGPYLGKNRGIFTLIRTTGSAVPGM